MSSFPGSGDRFKPESHKMFVKLQPEGAPNLSHVGMKPALDPMAPVKKPKAVTPLPKDEGVDKAEAALKEESRIEREALRKANADLRLENEVLCKLIGRQQAEIERLKGSK